MLLGYLKKYTAVIFNVDFSTCVRQCSVIYVEKCKHYEWCQAFTAAYMKSSLFWNFTQCRLVLCYRRLGKTTGPILKKKWIDSPETSVTNYQSTAEKVRNHDWFVIDILLISCRHLIWRNRETAVETAVLSVTFIAAKFWTAMGHR